jgi:hypothetical protein
MSRRTASLAIPLFLPLVGLTTVHAAPPAELMAVDGSALIPMRFIGQWLGAQVSYDPKTLGITFALNGHAMRLKLNSREASADNLPVLLAAPPMEVKGTTYLPLGFLSLYLGVPVDWTEESRVATVTHPLTGQKLMLQLPGGPEPPPAAPPMTPAQPIAPARLPTTRAEGPGWLHVTGTVALPGDTEPEYVQVSDDGLHWACVVSTATGQQVLDERGTPGPAYARCRGLTFAPVTGRLGYWGQDAERKVTLVVDEQAYPTTFVRPGMLLFSPNGERWAAVGWEGDAGDPNSRVATVLLDGQEVGKYWDAGIPQFTRDGAHVAFLSVETGTKRQVLVRDGAATEVSGDAAIELMNLVGPNMACQTDLGYAGDGSLFSICHGDRGWQVMLDSHIIATYRLSKFNDDGRNAGGGFDIGHIVYPSSLVVAEAAQTAAWWARPQPSSPWVCCLPGREIPANDMVDPAEDRIALSPDGAHVAFRLRHHEGQGEERHEVAQTVSLDGKSGTRFDAVRDIRFSPDSTRCAYLAERAGSSKVLYVIDQEGAGPDADEVSLFAFSPTGRHYAYLARHGEQQCVVVDGVEWPLPWTEPLALCPADDGNVRVVAREERQLLTASGAPAGGGLVASVR